MRVTGRIERVRRAAHERLQPPGVLRRRLVEERRRNRPPPGLERDAHLQPRVDRIAAGGRVLERGREIGVAAELSEMHALAVDADLELVLVLEAAHRGEVGPIQLHLQEILPIEGKRWRHQESADGSERQSFDVLVLRGVLAHA